ncbi:MAG TPA: protein kinase, partial [Kofleriaceae bacterium]|nr:protein kinase [Kofleriaceae bacterium]
MGEVYRARATMLGRDVALKILPEAFALDEERVARFTREAQILASLNHPSIAAIHDFQRFKCEAHVLASRDQSIIATIPGFIVVSNVFALVLELVEGETLADRIGHGPLPLDEALPIARQIADALEAAHERGIIHRDLKPANIKVTPDGVVKVLDFGLAKLTDPSTETSAGPAALSMSPTITSPAMMTGVGMILGTAAYMAPEQVKGRSADKRGDVWAFGCVLFEMLTGTRAFAGDDVAEVLSRVLQREPEWEALPPDVPQSIRTLLHGCLVKDRRKRIGDIATALFVLDHQTGLTAAGTVAAGPLPRKPLWRRVAEPTAGALMLAALGGAAVWLATRPAEPVPPRVSRLQVALAGAAALTIRGADRDLAITPDGSRVVYVGNNGTQLFVRALDALEPVVVFTGLPRGPFVSPDGQWIGFVDGVSALKKVAVTGGPAVTLATLDGNTPRGATWAPDDMIIVATSNATTGLLRVAAAGGPAAVLTRPDRAQGEADHLWP